MLIIWAKIAEKCCLLKRARVRAKCVCVPCKFAPLRLIDKFDWQMCAILCLHANSLATANIHIVLIIWM